MVLFSCFGNVDRLRKDAAGGSQEEEQEEEFFHNGFLVVAKIGFYWPL